MDIAWRCQDFTTPLLLSLFMEDVHWGYSFLMHWQFIERIKCIWIWPLVKKKIKEFSFFPDIDLKESISYTHIYHANIIDFLLYSILWDLQTVMKIRLQKWLRCWKNFNRSMFHSRMRIFVNQYFLMVSFTKYIYILDLWQRSWFYWIFLFLGKAIGNLHIPPHTFSVCGCDYGLYWYAIQSTCNLQVTDWEMKEFNHPSKRCWMPNHQQGGLKALFLRLRTFIRSWTFWRYV